MTNKTSLDVSVNLPSEVDKGISMLSHISGIDKHQLQKMKKAEVYTLLSYHIGLLSEEEQKLLSSHDQNVEADEVVAAEKWKLIKRGVIKEKKSDFGSVPKAAYDAVKYLIATLANRSRLAAENPGTERPMTIDPLAKINRTRYLNGVVVPVVAPKLMNIASTANVNIPKGEKPDVLASSSVKDFFRKWILRIEGEVIKGK